MKYDELSFSKSKDIFESWEDNEPNFNNLSPENMKLRNKFINAFERVKADHRVGLKNNNYKKYQFDLILGLEIYTILNENTGFTMRHASNPDIWRYINMVLVPDLLDYRWKRESVDRYYRRISRLYMSSLWWYIHLSWNDCVEDTYNILKSNSTDEIMNLVERAGYYGYRVDLTREIMKVYGTKKDKGRKLFRRILVLNTARSIVIEPSLYGSGQRAYVNSLFDDIMKGEEYEEASGSY